MVGVPAFVRCRAGVSSRIVSSPSWSDPEPADQPRPEREGDHDRRHRRHRRPERDVPEDVEPAPVLDERDEEVVEHQPSSPPKRPIRASTTCSMRMPREPFTSSASPGHQALQEQDDRVLERGRVVALGEPGRARRLDGGPRVAPDADELGHARGGNGAPGLPVSRLGARAQLEHVPEHDHPPGRAGPDGERVERGDQSEEGLALYVSSRMRDAARAPPHAAPLRGTRRLEAGGDLVEREAEGAARARRGQRIDDIVAAGEGQAHGALLPAHGEREAHAARRSRPRARPRGRRRRRSCRR